MGRGNGPEDRLGADGCIKTSVLVLCQAETRDAACTPGPAATRVAGRASKLLVGVGTEEVVIDRRVLDPGVAEVATEAGVRLGQQLQIDAAADEGDDSGAVMPGVLLDQRADGGRQLLLVRPVLGAQTAVGGGGQALLPEEAQDLARRGAILGVLLALGAGGRVAVGHRLTSCLGSRGICRKTLPSGTPTTPRG